MLQFTALSVFPSKVGEGKLKRPPVDLMELRTLSSESTGVKGAGVHGTECQGRES